MSIGNVVLDSLPTAELDELRPLLRKTTLDKGSMIAECGHRLDKLYFPTAGMISCLTTTSVGQPLEIYAAGSEDVIGVVGVQQQPWSAKVQISGRAATLDRREFVRLSPQLASFQQILLRYVGLFLSLLSQRVRCVSRHSMSQRLCSWLTLAAELSDSRDLECTQQSIAEVLGARRASVTVELGELQRRKLVHCGRGRIRVLSRAGLAAKACDCLAFRHRTSRCLRTGHSHRHMAQAGPA